MIKGLKIGIDLDDTIYPYWQMLRLTTYICKDDIEIFNLRNPTIRGFYELEWGLPHEWYSEVTRWGTDHGIMLWHGTPKDNSIRIINALAEHNSIHIVTARNEALFGPLFEAATHMWLSQHGVVYDQWTFTDDKHEVDVDVLIDDHQFNLNAFQQAKKPFILLRNELNQEAEAEYSTDDWLQIPKILEQMFN